MVVKLACCKGSDGFVIQAVRRCRACRDDIALIQLQLNRTCYSFVYLIEISAQCFTQRCVPFAAVNQFCEFIACHFVERLCFLVGAKIFQLAVCIVHDGTAGCFIYTTGFHTNHTVFADICDTNTVSAADFVQLCQESNGIQLFTIDCNGNTLFKIQCNIFGLIGCLFGCYTHLQNVFVVRFVCRVFQFQTLMAQVPQVSVTAVGVVMACFKGDTMVSQILYFILTGLHLPCIQSPGSDNLHFGCQRLDGQLKTHLIVALACCAVADCSCAFLFRNFNQSFCNDGACHGCTNQIFAFINSVCLYAGVNRICDEFFCQIFDIQLACAGFQCLFLQTVCFLALPNITAYADYFTVIIFFQPRDDCGCIQTAGICQNDFFFCHDFSSSLKNKPETNHIVMGFVQNEFYKWIIHRKCNKCNRK